jgi:molybdate transport system permease protein
LTLKVAGMATLVAFVAGLSLARLLTCFSFPGRDWLDAFLMLPLVLPPTVLGYILIVCVGRRGWLGRWLYDLFGISLVFTWEGAVLAAAVVSLPLMFRSAKAAFENVDRRFEDAARTLGASETGVFVRVTLPLAARGILAGTMLTFARAMGEFGATLMVAGNLPGRTQTLSMAVYDAIQAGHYSLGTTLVLIASSVSLSMLVASGKILKKEGAA